MISKFFIERPVLSNVIAILMMLIGAVALFNLAIAQYPDVVPPTVQVTTRYPGASAKTVIDTDALPIEQQVNGIEDMLYMQSYGGADGTYTLAVTFKIGTDLNFAQVWCRTGSPAHWRSCRSRCRTMASRSRRNRPRSCCSSR